MSNRKTFQIVAIAVILTFCLSCVAFFALTSSNNRIIYTWRQPDTVNYHSFDPYALSIVEEDIDWHRLFPAGERHYSIYIAHFDSNGDNTSPAYGYYRNFDTTSREALLEELRNTTIEWTPEGITLTLPSGLRYFIPADAFTGGRA